jgi:hypothetical protein
MFSGISGTTPWFDNVSLETIGNDLVCSAHVMDAFTEDFDKLIQIGDTLTVTIQVDVVDVETNEVVETKLFIHRIQFSLLEKRYDVFTSEKNRSVQRKELKQAKQYWMSLYRGHLIRLSKLEANRYYYLSFSATLEDIELPGMTNKLNMMQFWNRAKPEFKTENFMISKFS